MKKEFLTYLVLFFLMLPFSSLMSQWVQTSGPCGGPVMDMVTNGNDMYAGFNGGGVWLTSDWGKNWTDVSPQFGQFVSSLYASGSCVFAGADGHLFMTSDRGATWSIKTGDLPSYIYVNDFAESGQNLFIATYSGVFLSTDMGNNWIQKSSGITDLNVTSIISAGTDLYAGTSGKGVFKSTDYGDSWYPVNNGLTNYSIYSLVSLNSEIFAATGFGGIFETENKGESWTKKPINMYYTKTLAVNGSAIFAGGQDYNGFIIGQSTDGGNSWINISNGIKASCVFSIAAGNSQLFVGCFDTGVFTTTDYQAGWTDINEGIKASYVNTMDSDGEFIYCGTDGQGIFLSSDNGNNWTQANYGLKTGHIYDLAVKGSDIFAAALFGIYYSNDQGKSWNYIYNGISMYSVDFDGSTIAAGGTQKIYLSTDHGSTWSMSGLNINGTVMCIIVKGQIIYAGTTDGIFKSTDLGRNWTDISDGITSRNIRTMALSDGNLIIGIATGVWMLPDNETHWVNISQNTEIYYTEALLARSKVVIASSYNKIYKTTDLGKKWTLIADNLPNNRVNDMTLNKTYLFAGLEGASVCRCLIREIAQYNIFAPDTEERITAEIRSTESRIPSSYELKQNSPNPFNPSTTIEFSVPDAGSVLLKIYNITGQEVETLVNDELNAGVYKYTWTPKNLASGIYIYKLNAGKFTSIKKLVLMK